MSLFPEGITEMWRLSNYPQIQSADSGYRDQENEIGIKNIQVSRSS